MPGKLMRMVLGGRDARRSFAAALLLGLGLGIGAAVAADPPAGCFCIRHIETDAMLRGCRKTRGATDFYPTAWCIDPETQKRANQTLHGTDWEEVAAGAVGCDPCHPPKPETEERPRGNGGAADEDEPADGSEEGS